MINYIKHNEINQEKWDHCIQSSNNELVYAMSWYLNITSPQWDALIMGDYEIVMPVTMKKKWGTKYLCQAYFSQQLGIFSSNQITKETINIFLEKLIDTFKFIEINLNAGNVELDEKFNPVMRKCQQLSLDEQYAELISNYRRNHKRNINRAKHNKLVIEKDLREDLFIAHLQDSNASYLNKEMSIIAKKLVELSGQSGDRKMYGVYNSSNKLLSTGFFIKNNNTYYFVLSSTTQEGVESRAMFLLVDEFLKANAGQDIILNFAGSSMPGVESFNLGFGAESYYYTTIRITNFPKIINKTFQVLQTWKV